MKIVLTIKPVDYAEVRKKIEKAYDASKIIEVVENIPKSKKIKITIN